jgi:hypothetical protein
VTTKPVLIKFSSYFKISLEWPLFFSGSIAVYNWMVDPRYTMVGTWKIGDFDRTYSKYVLPQMIPKLVLKNTIFRKSGENGWN